MTDRTIPQSSFLSWAAIFALSFLIGGLGGCSHDEDEIHQQCLERARADKESCLNGGVINGVFKTSKRIKTCDEIYQRDTKACG